MTTQEPAACMLCGTIVPKRFRKGTHDIYRCAGCDLEFVHPIPHATELEEIYSSTYFVGAGHGYADYFVSERASNLVKADHRLRRLTQCGLAAHAKLLDVGCADGTFVAAARAQGFEAWGVEVSSDARSAANVETARWLKPDVQALPTELYFDCITLWDVLEHLSTPRETLQSLRTRLASGGLLSIVVPVIDNINARWFPTTWDQYKPPEHLWYFSIRSLGALLGSLGFETIHVESAWKRASRLIAASGTTKRPIRALSRLDSALWTAAHRLGLLPEHALDDSILVIARRTS